MNTKALRQKILDLAIHGKLVPQDPNDESATILLEKIKKNKQTDLFAPNGTHPKKVNTVRFEQIRFSIPEDEIPFEVPSGWAWARGADIFYQMTSKRPVGDTFRYIDIDAIDNKKHCITSPKVLSVSDAPSRASRELNSGDILFALVRPYLENIALVETENSDCIASTGFYVCKPKEMLNSKFAFYLMISDYVVRGLNQFMKGDNSPSISGDDIAKWYFPLPPFAEQRRIVAAIETIFAQVDELEQSKSDLQTAIKQAKSKILDLAIHGKLVPQDQKDEPASALLERLAKTDESLEFSERKLDEQSKGLRRTRHNRPYEKVDISEIDWDVPKGWALCHFGDIATVINGKNQKDVENPNGKYPIYGSGGIIGRANAFICPENCTIIGRKGSINNPIFVEEKFWNVDTAFGLLPSNAMLPKFLFYFCEYFDFTSLDNSTTLPSLTKTNIQQIVFALPPLQEQRRILEKIESLFAQLDEIILNLV